MAQDDCKGSEDKKVQKLIDKVRTGKMELGAKIAAMRDAIDMEEDCVECHYQLGLRLYRKSKANGSSYLEAIEEMMFVKNQCPTYNSDVYFYLGLMNYGTYKKDRNYQETMIGKRMMSLMFYWSCSLK
jgi:hypothetical protein